MARVTAHRCPIACQERKLPAHREGDLGLRDKVIAGEQGQHEAALAWMVEGACLWYEAGRVMPELTERVQADTDEWRSRANLVYGFAQEYLEPSAEHHVIADELYEFFSQTIKAALRQLEKWQQDMTEFTWALRMVLDRQYPGAWPVVMTAVRKHCPAAPR